MILTAHQPVYIPWLGLFQKIQSADLFCFFDIVQYQKKDFNNRNKIKTMNGEMWLSVPVETKGFLDKKINDKLKDILSGNNDKDIRDLLIDANKEFVLDHQLVFSNFLKDLVKYKEPTLFHCTAGKDRTGFAAYLIYSICGIDEDFIILDYLSSNKYIDKNIDTQIKNISKIMGLTLEEAKEMEPILRVDIDFITSAIDTIKENYNSCLLYTSPSPRDRTRSRMPSSA